MKRFTAALAALILAISLVPFAAFAANGKAVMSSATVNAGQSATLKVTLSGFGKFQSGSIEFTSLPSGISIKEGSWLYDESNEPPIKGFQKKDKCGVFSYEDDTDLNGDVFKVVLDVGKDVKSGKYEIKFNMQFMKNNGDYVSGTMQSGYITVNGASNPDTEPDTPSKDEPTSDEPASDEPQGDEPTEDEPTEDEPTEDEPTEDEPTEDEPTGDEQNEKTDSKKNDGLLPIILISVAGVTALAAIAYFVISLIKKKK